jgi:3-dehydroquinate dehydratase I
MICVSIAEETLDLCLTALEGVAFAEIRIDGTALSREDITTLFSGHDRLIATCRPKKGFEDDERKALLCTAIESGAAYVDLEVEAPEAYRREVGACARSWGCQVISSFHDYRATPERKALEAVIDQCFKTGADIAKIACRVHSGRDNARLLGLLDTERPLVVIGMGERGRITRAVAPILGSAFTFASRQKGKETAEGQIDRDSLIKLMEVWQLSNQNGGE